MVDYDAQAAALSAALAKLAPHHGVVYRGSEFPVSVTDGYRPGDVLREDAFTSASVHGGAAGPILYEIASTSGRLISEFAEDPAEGEVVFDRGTCFLTLALEQIGDRRHVLLCDVPDPSAAGIDAEAVAAAIRAARAVALGAGAQPGLAEGKAHFPVGIGENGQPNVVGHRADAPR